MHGHVFIFNESLINFCIDELCTIPQFRQNFPLSIIYALRYINMHVDLHLQQKVEQLSKNNYIKK